jgi:hypothetical protein
VSIENESGMVTGLKRRILVTGNLYFEYEVSPHRRIGARVNRKSPAAIGTQISAALSQTCKLSTQPPEGKAGLYMPHVRLLDASADIESAT